MLQYRRVPSSSRVPNVQPTVWLIIRVWANQLVRSSVPSTERMKSFWALIWLSQLTGGVSNAAPAAAFLNISLMSGLGCRPAPVVMRPSLIWNQRPVSSSRAMICATRSRSLSRARKTAWRNAWNFSSAARPNRMSESLMVEKVMSSSRELGAIGSALSRFCNLEAGRARLAQRRSGAHGPLDFTRARDRQWREPSHQRLVGMRCRQHEAEAAQNRAIAVENRRRDAHTAGIDLTAAHAESAAPNGSKAAPELLPAEPEAGLRDLARMVGEQGLEGAPRQVRQDDP